MISGLSAHQMHRVTALTEVLMKAQTALMSRTTVMSQITLMTVRTMTTALIITMTQIITMTHPRNNVRTTPVAFHPTRRETYHPQSSTYSL